MSSNTIPKVLKTDAKRRIVGIDGGLIPLEDLKLKSWDFGVPTLVDSGVETSFGERTICPDVGEFTKRFYEKYSLLEDVDMTGLLIAGSSVAQFITGGKQSWSANDVDIFIYGQKNTDASSARVATFIRNLADAEFRRENVKMRAAIKEDIQEECRKIEAAGGTSTIERCHYLREFEQKDLDYLILGDACDDDDCWPICMSDKPRDFMWRLVRKALRRDYTTWEKNSIMAVRTAGSISLTVEGLGCVQLILRHYATPSEILHGFDMGSAAVGFDGKQVVFTDLGRFAHEYGYNIVDTTRRSTTYEARLNKYMKRGFGIILPGLDIKKLPNRNSRYGYSDIAHLPHFPFAYNNIADNRIFLDKFLKSFGPASDYDVDLGDEGDEANFIVAYKNLSALVNDSENIIYQVSGIGILTALDVLHKPPHLTLEMIQRLYDIFRKSVWDGASLNLRTIERYLPLVDVVMLIKGTWERSMDEELDVWFAAQREAASRLWKRRIRDADHSKLPWVTENPGGQKSPLTGSLNPIMESAADWYGEYWTGHEL